MRGAVSKRPINSPKGTAEEVRKLSLVRPANVGRTVWRTTRDLAWILFSGALFWTIIICASYSTAVLVVVSFLWHSRPLGLILSSSFRERCSALFLFLSCPLPLPPPLPRSENFVDPAHALKFPSVDSFPRRVHTRVHAKLRALLWFSSYSSFSKHEPDTLSSALLPPLDPAKKEEEGTPDGRRAAPSTPVPCNHIRSVTCVPTCFSMSMQVLICR